MKKERTPGKEKYYYFIYDVITWEKIYKLSSTYYLLYAPDVRNVTARATMKSLLTTADPGGVSAGGVTLHALSRESAKCLPETARGSRSSQRV